MAARWITPLVLLRPRKGHRSETTCYCDAAPWPHRAGSVAGCYGLAFCEHGNPTADHPDYEGRCAECECLEWGDFQYHLLRDEGRVGARCEGRHTIRDTQYAICSDGGTAMSAHDNGNRPRVIAFSEVLGPLPCQVVGRNASQYLVQAYGTFLSVPREQVFELVDGWELRNGQIVPAEGSEPGGLSACGHAQAGDESPILLQYDPEPAPVV